MKTRKTKHLTNIDFSEDIEYNYSGGNNLWKNEKTFLLEWALKPRP